MIKRVITLFLCNQTHWINLLTGLILDMHSFLQCSLTFVIFFAGVWNIDRWILFVLILTHRELSSSLWLPYRCLFVCSLTLLICHDGTASPNGTWSYRLENQIMIWDGKVWHDVGYLQRKLERNNSAWMIVK